MLQTLSFIAGEALLKLGRRSRTRKYLARSAPFEHVNHEGLRFLLEPHEEVDKHIAVDGIYDRRFLAFVRSILPPEAVVADIGANIGNHALYLHRACAAVHCFEPNPRVFRRLEANIALNRAGNIHVHRVGLGNDDGLLTFATNTTGNLGNSGFVKAGEPAREGFEIEELPIRKADAAIARLRFDRLDFIKIDVEGLEQDLFQGLRETISRYRPIVAFEHHGKLVADGVFESISDCLPGYAITELVFAPEGSSLMRRVLYHLRHAGRPRLSLVTQPERRSYENLIAIPREHPLFAQV